MPSLSERQRNNVKAGVFVSVAIALGLGVVIVLTGALEKFRRSTKTYTVVFDVASGVPNLKRGSEVRVGGLRMGAVTKITPRLVPGSKTLKDIEVEFNLDDQAQLFTDAQIFVSAPLIGSEGWLDIPNVGMSNQEATSGIPGATSAGFLTTLLGGDNKAKTETIVNNVVEFSDFLANVPVEYDTKVVPIIDDVKATTGDVRSIASDLRTNKWPTWSGKVDEIMTWAASLQDRVNGAIDEGTGLLTDARGVIGENRESIKSAVANVDDITKRVKNETMEKVHQLLDSGQQGVDSAVATLRNLQVDYDGWSTELGETLGNATIASQQLKLATIEVRRSPWKLLYRPTADELQHELLYESARSFAVAASDVKAAAASVQRALDSNNASTLRDADAFKRLQQNLMDSLTRYEKAQQQMLDVIIADRPKP